VFLDTFDRFHIVGLSSHRIHWHSHGWENIDHLIKILPDGTERIPCVEINSNNDTKFLVTSVYLPSKGNVSDLDACDILPLY
jgi:hypothetical protein